MASAEEKIKKYEAKLKDEKFKGEWDLLKKMIKKLKSEETAMEELTKKLKKVVDVKKPKAKKSKKKSKKPTGKTMEQAKSDLKKKVGKTEEECEDIIAQYKKLRAKGKKRKEVSKKRVKKLKAEDKVIAGTDVKTADAAVEKAKDEVKDKITKEVKSAENKAKKKEAKTDKPAAEKKKAVKKAVEKKTKEVSKALVIDTTGMIKAITAGLSKFDKSDAKSFLLKLRADIDKLISSYAWGGQFAGDVQVYNIAQNQSSSSVNPSQFGEGGEINPYRDNREEIIEELKKVKSYDGRSPNIFMDEEGYISVSAEMADGLADYYGEFTDGSPYIDEKLEKVAEKYDTYWEWQDAGSIVLFPTYKKGGKTQGYDDEQDESLGIRTGRESSKKQSMRDRREDSYGKWGRRDEEDRDISMKRGGKTLDDFVDDETYAAGGFLLGSAIGGYVGYKVGRARTQKTGFDTEKRIAAKIKKGADKTYKELQRMKKEHDEARKKKKATAHKKGGKTQGYNAREDESLGESNGKESRKSQSRKSRRDESSGMEKSLGRRKYQRVGTMDDEDWERGWKMKKGGKTDWVQKMVDSPDFHKGAFTKWAKAKGWTTEHAMKEVLSNPSRYTLKTRRRAQAMKNMQ